MALRVLVVEDDATTRKLMETIVAKYFNNVDVAEDGEQAAALFTKALTDNPYNLVFLDISMPNKTGQEALKEMRDAEYAAGIQPSEIAKIVMTTSLEDSKNILEAFRELCDAYLIKPVLPEHIDAKLEEFGFK